MVTPYSMGYQDILSTGVTWPFPAISTHPLPHEEKCHMQLARHCPTSGISTQEAATGLSIESWLHNKSFPWILTGNVVSGDLLVLGPKLNRLLALRLS